MPIHKVKTPKYEAEIRCVCASCEGLIDEFGDFARMLKEGKSGITATYHLECPVCKSRLFKLEEQIW